MHALHGVKWTHEPMYISCIKSTEIYSVMAMQEKVWNWVEKREHLIGVMAVKWSTMDFVCKTSKGHWKKITSVFFLYSQHIDKQYSFYVSCTKTSKVKHYIANWMFYTCKCFCFIVYTYSIYIK